MKIKHVTLLARRIFLSATTWFARGAAVRAMGILGLALLLGHTARAQTILGSTGSYAVMAGSTVTSTGTTAITRNLGSATGVAGGSYTLTGTQVAITTQNQTDFTKAYNGLAVMAVTQNLTGQNLGGLTLTPGVYEFEPLKNDTFF